MHVNTPGHTRTRIGWASVFLGRSSRPHWRCAGLRNTPGWEGNYLRPGSPVFTVCSTNKSEFNTTQILEPSKKKNTHTHLLEPRILPWKHTHTHTLLTQDFTNNTHVLRTQNINNNLLYSSICEVCCRYGSSMLKTFCICDPYWMQWEQCISIDVCQHPHPHILSAFTSP